MLTEAGRCHCNAELVTVQYSTVQYSTVQGGVIVMPSLSQYSTVQHSTGRCHCNAELVAAGAGKMGEGIN